MAFEVEVNLHIGKYVFTIKAENEEKLQEILRSIGFNESEIVEIQKVVL